MPFTPSHVAAILPLRGRMSGALPFAALAIGSMSPDLPYYLPGVRGLSALTHTAWAVPSLDVVLGLVAWLLWRWLAPALKELAPVAIQQRWRLPSERPRWWGVLLALAIGAATHVLLDEFTHVGRFGATHLAVLAASYPSPLGSSWEGYRWAQYLLGAIGLGILAWVGWRTPADSVAAQPVPAGPLAWLGGRHLRADRCWRLPRSCRRPTRRPQCMARPGAGRWHRGVRSRHRDHGRRPHRAPESGHSVHSGPARLNGGRRGVRQCRTWDPPLPGHFRESRPARPPCDAWASVASPSPLRLAVALSCS